MVEQKLYIGGVDSDDERCLRCGSPFLDTGWECTDCGYDNQPHYYQSKDAQPQESQSNGRQDEAPDVPRSLIQAIVNGDGYGSYGNKG